MILQQPLTARQAKAGDEKIPLVFERALPPFVGEVAEQEEEVMYHPAGYSPFLLGRGKLTSTGARGSSRESRVGMADILTWNGGSKDRLPVVKNVLPEEPQVTYQKVW